MVYLIFYLVGYLSSFIVMSYLGIKRLDDDYSTIIAFSFFAAMLWPLVLVALFVLQLYYWFCKYLFHGKTLTDLFDRIRYGSNGKSAAYDDDDDEY